MPYRVRKRKLLRLTSEKICQHHLRSLFDNSDKRCENCHFFKKIDNQRFCTLPIKERESKLV